MRIMLVIGITIAGMLIPVVVVVTTITEYVGRFVSPTTTIVVADM